MMEQNPQRRFWMLGPMVVVALVLGVLLGKGWERYKLRDGRWIAARALANTADGPVQRPTKTHAERRLTLDEVGRTFNVTRERIRQIEAKALRKLRHPSRSRKLKDYLE